LKIALLAIVASSVSVFGGSISLTGGSTSVTFDLGTMTFGTNPITGSFNAPVAVTPFSVGVIWDVSGTSFGYSLGGAITTNNNQTFSLSADSGADTLTGTVDLLSVANAGATSAGIAGTLHINTVSFASTQLDQALYAALTAENGGVAVATGENFALVIGVTGCNIANTSSNCIITTDPVGTASSLTLTQTTTPEPATAGLLGSGLCALLFFKRRFTGRVIH
jgi:hypothetical protein